MNEEKEVMLLTVLGLYETLRNTWWKEGFYTIKKGRTTDKRMFLQFESIHNENMRWLVSLAEIRRSLALPKEYEHMAFIFDTRSWEEKQ